MSVKKILSIDGGGIKGIIPARILAYLESEKQKINPAYHLSDSFDLIAGTSTGGIIALGLLTNKPKTNEPYLADELKDLYVKYGKTIFSTNLLREASSFFHNAYSADNLEKYLHQYFGDTKLDELKPCLIPTYDVFDRRTWFFNSEDAKKGNDAGSHDFLVRDVARATSAAPTYFNTPNIKSLSQVDYPFIDGGVFANNPAACALVELIDMEREKKNDINLSHIQILSLGTGVSICTEKKYTYNKVKHWGEIQWASPVIDIMMSASSETVDYQLRTIFQSITPNKKSNYYRVQPEINRASAEMDIASEENINNLLQDAASYITNNEDYLQDIIQNVL